MWYMYWQCDSSYMTKNNCICSSYSSRKYEKLVALTVTTIISEKVGFQLLISYSDKFINVFIIYINYKYNEYTNQIL